MVGVVLDSPREREKKAASCVGERDSQEEIFFRLQF
jgi:hypothetical protein